MRKRSPTVSIDVDVDVEEVLDGLSEAELKEILSEYLPKGSQAWPGLDVTRDLVIEAYEALMRNRPADALALLERAIHPTIGLEEKYGALLIEMGKR